MSKLVLLCFVIFSIASLPAFSQTATSERVVLAAVAANIGPLGDTLKTAFAAKHPAVKLEFTYGASGTLTTQIENGAPFELFLSADTAFPQKLFEENLSAKRPVVYATGTVVLLSVKPVGFSKGLRMLLEPEITQFALANPDLAPYGRAAREALVKQGLWDEAKTKAVIAQTITQALQYTVTATGIGFVSKSALYANEFSMYNREGVNWIAVDPSLHAPIDQAFVVLKKGENNPYVLAFADFLQSKAAKDIFVSFGYSVPR